MGLVLRVSKQETIVIDDRIRINLYIESGQMKAYIEAPPTVKIRREYNGQRVEEYDGPRGHGKNTDR